MRTLKQIVDHYTSNFTALGEDKSELDSDIENIRKELKELITANYKKTRILSLCIIVVIVVCAILSIIWSRMGNLDMWANIITVTGIAPLTLIGYLVQWQKDRQNANTLLRMIDSLNKESFYSILAVFASMLKK